MSTGMQETMQRNETRTIFVVRENKVVQEPVDRKNVFMVSTQLVVLPERAISAERTALQP